MVFSVYHHQRPEPEGVAHLGHSSLESCGHQPACGAMRTVKVLFTVWGYEAEHGIVCVWLCKRSSSSVSNDGWYYYY